MEQIVNMNLQLPPEDTWTVSLEGKYTGAVTKALINDEIPVEGVNKILSNSAKVLGNCPNPETDENVNKTGIVIGKVQSGKTSNFIMQVALSFDNGYEISIVFGGTKKVLVKQNRESIEGYFESLGQEVCVLDTTTCRELLDEEHITQLINRGKKIIIVALKNNTQINYIVDNVFSNSLLSEKAILIIDDEGDEASINTLIKKGKKSATYRAIENLKNALRRHCFVSVTATPQANILIDTIDILSPDFGVLVDPGDGYCGLDVFHNAEKKYTVPINAKESSLLDDGIPESFIKALSMYFVACAINKNRTVNKVKQMSMLIHPSQLKADHSKVCKKVTDVITSWKRMSSNKRDISYDDLQKILFSAYNQYKTDGVRYLLPFEELEDSIIEVINYCCVHTVNGDKVPNGVDKYYDWNIYVGGAMLGRGLVIKGLTVTYIIRTSKGISNVDTVEQRARWFGYKRKYLELCRVFAMGKILTEFQSIREHEEDVWDTIRRANLQGKSFKQMERIFILSDNLKMTNTSKAVTDQYNFSFWNKQTDFMRIPEYIDSNISIISKFRNKYQDRIITRRYGNGAPYRIIENVKYGEVNSELLSKFKFPQESKLGKGIFEKLEILFTNKKINAVVDVIWMRDGTTSNHDIDDQNHIPNYMVGRRPQSKELTAIYKGDADQFVKDDVMQLQVHMIRDNKTGTISPTLALYIPKNYIEKLTNLVIRK